ncbi:hypothetical protein [Escherichia coli]|uniref:hypothetical protein n=1 Tax=Escherichia coli TaxID=562 RepID=UPI003CCB74C4
MTVTQPKIGYLPNQNLVTCKTEYKDKNIKTKEERLKGNFEEESLKKGASLCDSHSCDSLGIEEAIKEASKTSDLDDLEVSSKKTSKQDKEISDVNVDSDHKNTQCPATDDEMDPFDDYLDEKAEREEAIKKAQRKAEIKSRIKLAKQKNKVSDLDDFDDGDDDFTYRPKKKTHTEPKKEGVKVRRVYGGGMF